MQRLFKGLSAGLLLAAASSPALACQGEHGYKKTADALQQSTMTADTKADLTQRLERSQATHDKYTLTGEFGKMNEAVQEVSEITRQIRK